MESSQFEKISALFEKRGIKLDKEFFEPSLQPSRVAQTQAAPPPVLVLPEVEKKIQEDIAASSNVLLISGPDMFIVSLKEFPDPVFDSCLNELENFKRTVDAGCSCSRKNRVKVYYNFYLSFVHGLDPVGEFVTKFKRSHKVDTLEFYLENTKIRNL